MKRVIVGDFVLDYNNSCIHRSYMSDLGSGVIYEFGPFQADRLKRQLIREGRSIPITTKAFETLLILVAHSGEVVTKTELIDAIWSDTTVEENNLTQQISAIRKALGERPSEHKFIVTIPGRGYTFIAPVREIVNFETPPVTMSQDTGTRIPYRLNSLQTFTNWRGHRDRGQWLRTALGFVSILVLLAAGVFWVYLRKAVSPRPTQTIAVLPFKSLDRDDEFLGAGMRDTLTAKLGNLQELNVRPTMSADKYAGQDPIAAGRELQVDAVLNGTIQHDGEQVRVTVQILDVAGGRILWGKSFDRTISGAFAVQDSISTEIVKSVEEYYAAN